MNDPDDCRIIFEMLKKKAGLSPSEETKRDWIEFLNFCNLNYPIPYIASFSKVAEDISQWDRYADSAGGVCIEFKDDYFGEEKYPSHNVLREHNLVVYGVEYSENVQQSFVDSIFNLILSTADKTTIEKERSKAFASALISQRGPTFKSNSYASEQEKRLIHTPGKFDVDGLTDIQLGYINHRRIRKSKYSDETPYVVLEVENIKDSILSITSGPKCTRVDEIIDFCREKDLVSMFRKSTAKFR